MSRGKGGRVDVHIGTQTSSAWTSSDANFRDEELSLALGKQEVAFDSALEELRKVREFLGSPENILGSERTKHGEIAEQVHVGTRRALDIVQQRIPGASMENVPRTGPVDYMDNGLHIQSKFHNGLENTLRGVLSHSEKYPGFASSDGAYHIPRDQADQLRQLGEIGTIDGFSDRKVERICQLLERIERSTGQPSDDILKPAEATYAEVQKGRAHGTVDDRERVVEDRNKEMVAKAHDEHAPSLSGVTTAAAFGAAAGGGVSLTQMLWRKYRDGKNIFKGEFTIEDWQDVGLGVAKGAGIGAVTGGVVYCLTNSTDLAAPFAGALVSCMVGVGDLLMYYRSGEIDCDQFVDCSLMIAAEASMVGLSAVAGQTIIPVPVLGTFLGSCAGKLVTSVIRSGFDGLESELIGKLDAYEAETIRKLDVTLRTALDDLDTYFGQLSALMKIAFDETTNTQLRLQTSVQIAELAGVPDNVILRSNSDLDAFMEE